MEIKPHTKAYQALLSIKGRAHHIYGTAMASLQVSNFREEQLDEILNNLNKLKISIRKLKGAYYAKEDRDYNQQPTGETS